MTAILGNDGHNLLCRLYAEYKAGRSNTETLKALRAELGETEYHHFQEDLQRKMRHTSAWMAVAEIIGEAIKRKQALREQSS